jgi:hypothetical protein
MGNDYGNNQERKKRRIIKMQKKNKKTNEEKLIKLTEKAIFYGEQIRKILPKKIQSQGESKSWDYDGQQLSKAMQKRIIKLTTKLNDMDINKEELILKIIGQLYEGVLIPDFLTIRQGKFYRYKTQSQLDLGNVKRMIEQNKATISKRLDKSSSEMLEFMLQKYDKKYSDDERQKTIKINEINVFKNETDGSYNDEMYINCYVAKVDTILIKANGEIHFCHQNKDELHSHDFYTKIYDGLFIKFKKEIKQNAELFVQELEADINSFEKDMIEIKDKGQNQLAFIELSNQNNGEQE